MPLLFWIDARTESESVIISRLSVLFGILTYAVKDVAIAMP